LSTVDARRVPRCSGLRVRGATPHRWVRSGACGRDLACHAHALAEAARVPDGLSRGSPGSIRPSCGTAPAGNLGGRHHFAENDNRPGHAGWKKRASSVNSAGRRHKKMISSFLTFGATIILPDETEAGGSAGKQPCRGITWWAHRDDDRSAEASLPRSSKNHIGSVDPDALKIPGRRAECSLTENARSPLHAEPGQSVNGPT
jgi:hypothetical protein